MFRPVCWRSESTKASPPRPRPGGSLVPRAKMTSTSGQSSAEATAEYGAAYGLTSRPVAVTSAEPPRPTQRNMRWEFTRGILPTASGDRKFADLWMDGAGTLYLRLNVKQEMDSTNMTGGLLERSSPRQPTARLQIGGSRFLSQSLVKRRIHRCNLLNLCRVGGIGGGRTPI